MPASGLFLLLRPCNTFFFSHYKKIPGQRLYFDVTTSAPRVLAPLALKPGPFARQNYRVHKNTRIVRPITRNTFLTHLLADVQRNVFCFILFAHEKEEYRLFIQTLFDLSLFFPIREFHFDPVSRPFRYSGEVFGGKKKSRFFNA